MKKTVAYFPGDYTIVYALAACLRAGFNLHPAANMQDLWGINTPHIILLDIDNANPAFTDLNTYQELMSTKILGRILLADLRSGNQVLHDNFYTRRIWKHAFDIDDFFESITSSKTDSRHARALHAASVKARNTGDPEFYTKTLETIAHEIAGFTKFTEIDLLAIFCERVSETTKATFERISCDHKVFDIPNREVAYAYLANISPWLDLDEIKRMAKERYPYLCILQYRANDQEYTWLATSGSRLNIRQFFDLPSNNIEHQFNEETETWVTRDTNDQATATNEFVGIGSHKYISRYLKNKIKELTTIA